jgi:phosphoribosylformylglycinamidine synthase
MRAVVEFAGNGGPVLGICNGFQVLIESGILEGALLCNDHLKFNCKDVDLRVETSASAYTQSFKKGDITTFQIANHDGNYVADQRILQRLEADDRIAFRYEDNPNGSTDDIAGILSQNRRVLGMMPHPERMIDPALGGDDGLRFFRGLIDAFAPA